VAKRLHLILPALATAVATPLLLWEIHLAPLRFSYDAGVPIWPFQVPELLLSVFDFPGLLFAFPFERAVQSYSYWAYSHAILVFVATPLVWWWIGDRLDFGRLRPPYRSPRLFGLLLFLIVFGFCFFCCVQIVQDLLWARSYQTLERFWLDDLLTDVPPFAWSLIGLLAIWRPGLQLIRRESTEPATTSRRDQLLTLSALIVWAAALGFAPAVGAFASYNHADRSPWSNADSCETDAESGCIHGTVKTDGGEAIRGIHVEAIPRDAGLEDSSETTTSTSTFTDRKGRYSFDRLPPGDYFVGIHLSKAPTEKEPFLRTYYPFAEDKGGAARITINKARLVTLGAFHLRPLPLTSFSVEVRWSDGSHPVRSNLLVRNEAFDQGVIGDNAPQIANGAGVFTLPSHFEYGVRAAVSCDEGSRIGQRETPYLQLHVGDQPEPTHVVLTLPGTPCKLWQPGS
jgi:hypothetical protein